MKYIFINSLPISLFILAGFLAYNNLPYWGWCIVAGVLTSHTFGGK